jgi:membrane-associated protein
MLESVSQKLHAVVQQYPDFAPFLVFLCIACSSLTFVVSLDLLILTAAMIGVYFESYTPFLIACFCGTFFCGQVDYWIGRLVGNRLLKIQRISKLLPKERLDQVQNFFVRYGPLTFIVGRFIPFGFRLAMFIGAGIFKYRYPTFIFADLVASFIWTSCIFTLFYNFGQHAHVIKDKIVYVLALLFLIGLVVLTIHLIRKRYALPTNNTIADKDSTSSSLSDDEL